jgi:tRNA(fMet)-specific endonuclease VapC
MFILDTDILTLLQLKHPNVLPRFNQKIDDVAITVISYFEVLQGRISSLFKAGDSSSVARAERSLRESEAYLAPFPCFGFNPPALHFVDVLRANKTTKKMGLKDLLIASIALAQDATLVTRNAKDFNKVPNLKLENWAD